MITKHKLYKLVSIFFILSIHEGLSASSKIVDSYRFGEGSVHSCEFEYVIEKVKPLVINIKETTSIENGKQSVRRLKLEYSFDMNDSGKVWHHGFKIFHLVDGDEVNIGRIRDNMLKKVMSI